MQMTPDTLAIAYLISAVLFILGLKGLTSPATARRGNYMAMVGMVIAIVATLMSPDVHVLRSDRCGRAHRSAIGVVVALKIKMTAMPQLVAMLHSFVGLAAVLVAIGTFLNHEPGGTRHGLLMVELAAGTVIGAITFTGSWSLSASCRPCIGSAPLVFKLQHWLNLAARYRHRRCWASTSWSTTTSRPDADDAAVLRAGCAADRAHRRRRHAGGHLHAELVLGVGGGGHGLHAENKLLIITGALVGFSGAILSYIMCKAMNRGFHQRDSRRLRRRRGGRGERTRRRPERGVKSAGAGRRRLLDGRLAVPSSWSRATAWRWRRRSTRSRS